MRINLSAVANVATLATCVFVAYVALGARPTRPAGVNTIEEVTDVTTPLPRSEVRGDPRAQAVVIEFTDFQCPFCGRHARDTFPAIQKEFIDTGRIRWAVRHLPLDIHPAAYGAAKGASCAGEQQRYWAMHERLFALQSELALSTVTRAAVEVGVSRAQFDACMAAPAPIVEADRAEAKRLGVLATPTFLIGHADGHGNVRVKTKVHGSVGLVALRQAIAKVAGHNPG